MISLTLTPRIGVGEFILGSSIEQYLGKYDLFYNSDEFVLHEFGGTWVYKAAELSLDMTKDENKILSISCYKFCFYKTHNLIGMLMPKFIDWTGWHFLSEPKVYDFECDGLPQMVYDLREEWLQIWVKANKIVSISLIDYRTDSGMQLCTLHSSSLP